MSSIGFTNPNIFFDGILPTISAFGEHPAQTTEALLDRIGGELGHRQHGDLFPSTQALLQALDPATAAQPSVTSEIAAMQLFTFAEASR